MITLVTFHIGTVSPAGKLDVDGTILTRVPIDPSAAVHWSLRTSSQRWTWCLGAYTGTATFTTNMRSTITATLLQRTI